MDEHTCRIDPTFPVWTCPICRSTWWSPEIDAMPDDYRRRWREEMGKRIRAQVRHEFSANEATVVKPFPILIGGPKDPECPRFIRWDALNEEWAQNNHGQTLARLAERGGLSPCEAAANIERRTWRKMEYSHSLAIIKPFACSAPTVNEISK